MRLLEGLPGLQEGSMAARGTRPCNATTARRPSSVTKDKRNSFKRCCSGSDAVPQPWPQPLHGARQATFSHLMRAPMQRVNCTARRCARPSRDFWLHTLTLLGQALATTRQTIAQRFPSLTFPSTRPLDAQTVFRTSMPSPQIAVCLTAPRQAQDVTQQLRRSLTSITARHSSAQVCCHSLVVLQNGLHAR